MMGPLEPSAPEAAVVCPRCEARYDHHGWRSLALLDRVDLVDVGWLEVRRCESCDHVIAAEAEEAPDDELLPTDAAARYCSLSVSGFRQAARRGEIRPWTSTRLKLLWRRADLDRFLQARLWRLQSILQ